MTAKTVTIAVAVIGAVATLGAALLSNSGKPVKSKDQASPLQQTSSGAGAVNAGRDAYITNNIAKSAAKRPRNGCRRAKFSTA